MEQQTGSKSEKEYVKTVYLAYMQNTSWEMLGWMKLKLESRLLGEISITSKHADDTTLMAESKERTKEPLDEEGEWKSWLKIQHSENYGTVASDPITSWQIDGEAR